MDPASPRLVDLPALALAGTAYVGDPFTSHAGWTEENEIGRLWARLVGHLARLGATLPAVTYEVHVRSAESERTGELEVFAGYRIPGPGARSCDDLAVELVAKVLPAGRYVELELLGSELSEDNPVLGRWFAENGYREDGPFVVLRYDERFLGTDRLEESVVTFLMPVRHAAVDGDVPA